MSWSKVSRRRFLKGAAGASLALPLFSSLQPRSGRAATTPTKKRIIFVYMPHQETTGFTPDASFSGSPIAPMCMKNTRGSSKKKWLCSPVTSRLCAKAASIAGVTSS